MAYSAKRKKIYEEEFLLTEEDGTVVHTLHVALDADSMVKKLSEKYVALTDALKNVKDVREMQDGEAGKKMELLGNTVMDILETVFGKEDAKIILEFYDSRYIEMCHEVMPFVTDIVIPQIRKIAQSNKKQTLKQYNRKQRRALFAGRDKSWDR